MAHQKHIDFTAKTALQGALVILRPVSLADVSVLHTSMSDEGVSPHWLAEEWVDSGSDGKGRYAVSPLPS